jgi:CheY-like chemotaxis protein
MSHEIRTPLHGVSGAIDLLRRSRLDAGQQQALDILDHSNKVLTHWVETLLDHSRLDQSAIPSTSRPMTTSDPLFDAVEPGRPDFVTSSMPAPFDGLPTADDVAPATPSAPRPSTARASSTVSDVNPRRTPPSPSPSPASAPSLWARPPSGPDIRHRPPRPDSRPLVLLVEDHPVNQLLAHTMLEQIGCDVTVASDGLEAVERFEAARDRPFDLVLMDCQMPVMDGFAASRAMRSLEVREQRLPTPIVAMTANSEAEGAPACREAGMDDYVTKPVAMSRLTQAVTDWTWVPPGPRAMSTY